ncbi:hypothetical protein C5167_035524 [Papaver somniferum]|uniref:Snurportin-1 n=1 Tax=Papaver somniferum TaxID=3469 RepID=A0A4Y7KHI7_PAPSO|nr:hypothetical protein C5167_035524 [Papaver somniferum]
MDFDVLGASKLKGPEARKCFSRQLMLPEWMIDIPPCLNHDWYVYARPSGKRCLVVSSAGTTVSRLRNGPSCTVSHLPCRMEPAAQEIILVLTVCWTAYFTSMIKPTT